jgi:hypothetical protein
MKKVLLTATIALIGMSSLANASFVSTDWKVKNDGLATLDTVSGLEWLDLSETQNKNIEFVHARLDTDYIGWRLPTMSEVHSLTVKAFPTIDQSFDGWVYNIQTEVSRYQSFFGFVNERTFKSTGLRYYRDNGSITGFGVNFDPNSDRAWITPNKTGHTLSPNSPASYGGVFLVSDGGTTLSSIANPSLNGNNSSAPSAVSAPLALGLMSIGMLAFSRRKNIKGLK